MTETISTLAEANREPLARLEERLGHRFRDRALLQQALVHSSFAAENSLPPAGNNERLEFLGDAVLDLAISAALFGRFPRMREGELSRLRAGLVNAGQLATMAAGLGLGEYLLLGKGEEATDGRRKPSILACAYEAVVGAVFLDGGHGAAMALVEAHFTPLLVAGKEAMLGGDAKSLLQELSQERCNEAPVYMLEKEEGPAHAKFFTVSVRLRGTVLATGSGSSKKEAEQQAAAVALRDFASHDLDR
ncbi:MAG: ribonuclease III [Desulfobulbaceae bacterium]|nr:ribonuclease III [Desulfobulbaceae bacterium]